MADAAGEGRAHWHRVPTRLTDALMPALRDTELRVLLVVLRATWGWRAAPDAPATRRREWLSHALLCRRTGRGSEAVSGAVDALVRSGLLAVEDSAGRPLTTPAERRRYLGRLYYRAGDALVAARDPEPAAGHVPGLTPPVRRKTGAVRRPDRGMWKTTAGTWKTLGQSLPVKPKMTIDRRNNREGLLEERLSEGGP